MNEMNINIRNKANQAFRTDEDRINALLCFAQRYNLKYEYIVLPISKVVCEVQIHLFSQCETMKLSASFLCEASPEEVFEPDFDRVEILFDFDDNQLIRYYSMSQSMKAIMKFIVEQAMK